MWSSAVHDSRFRRDTIPAKNTRVIFVKYFIEMDNGGSELVQVRIVSVEGNIGAGKSHLLRELRTTYVDASKGVIHVYVEPSSATNIMLALFYTDPARYGAAMQFYILMLRLMIMRAVYMCAAKHPGCLIIVERCFPADMVFVLANHYMGWFPKQAFQDYMRIMHDILAALPMPSAFVMLDASSDECIHRIKTLRDRECEKGIETSYLDMIGRAYADLQTRVVARGSQWVALDWSLFGTAEQFLETANAMPPVEIDPHAAIAAIGNPPPVLAGSDAAPTGLMARLAALFDRYLGETGTTLDEVKVFHADALRKSAYSKGNACLDE